MASNRVATFANTTPSVGNANANVEKKYEKSYWFVNNKLVNLLFTSDSDYTEQELKDFNNNKFVMQFQNIKCFSENISEKLKDIDSNAQIKIFEVIFDGLTYLRIGSKGNIDTYKANATSKGKSMLSNKNKLVSL